jgi:precorrin-6B methylase 1
VLSSLKILFSMVGTNINRAYLYSFTGRKPSH